MNSYPEMSGKTVAGDIVGRDNITQGLSEERLVAVLESHGILQFPGSSGGVNIAGVVGSVAGDIVGGNKIVQSIDAETTAKINHTHADVTEVLTFIKGNVTRLRSTDEHLMLKATRHEAEKMCDMGRPEDASRAFMEALEREEQTEQQRREDHRRLRVKILEEAISYDKRAMNADAASAKIRLLAETIHPGERKAQVQYLFSRAAEFQEVGKLRGDNAALLIAVSVFSWLAKDTVNAE